MSDLDSICLDGPISGSNLSNLSRWASGLDISKFGIPDSRWTYSGSIHALRSNRIRFIFTNLGISKLEGPRRRPVRWTARSAVCCNGAKRRLLGRREAPSVTPAPCGGGGRCKCLIQHHSCKHVARRLQADRVRLCEAPSHFLFAFLPISMIFGMLLNTFWNRF